MDRLKREVVCIVCMISILCKYAVMMMGSSCDVQW